MYYITYQDGTKVLKRVTSRQHYLALRGSDSQKRLVAEVRNGHEEAKRKLLQICYQCIPGEDMRLKGCQTASQFVALDIDHLKEEEMAAVKERILGLRDEIGLLMGETSARGAGYHIVCRRDTSRSQVENLQHIAERLGVQWDEAAKDITRVFFTTTDAPEDLWWLDEGDELFGPEIACEVVPGREQMQGVAANGQAIGEQWLAAQPVAQQVVAAIDQEQPAEPVSQNATVAEGAVDEGTAIYAKGSQIQRLPMEKVVSALEDLLGGVPAHGSRNQFIFTMACHLRYVCNHDAAWVDRVLPAYGEEAEKKRRTVASACSRKMNASLPKALVKALEMVLAEVEQEEENPGFGTENEPPVMPRRLPGLVKLMTSRTPDIYKAAVAHAIFPALGAYLWQVRFPYIDNVEHEATLMNVLMAGSGAGKSCIVAPIDHIMADIRRRDDVNRERERQWKEEMQTRASNKDKRKRPEGIVIQEIDPDTTNAAFVMRMSEAEGRFLYSRMNEIDQFDSLRSSAKNNSQFQIMCLAFDPGNIYGQTRVGTASVSERVCIRYNWNASTTIQKGQQYFRSVLIDGPLSRINFCTIPEQPIGAPMPRYGKYDEEFDRQLAPYIDRLNAARGVIESPQAEALARKLCRENADFASLSNNRTYENLSFRANVIAYLKGMVLFVANGYVWDKTIEDFVRWSERYDMWCKMRFFGDAIEAASQQATGGRHAGPRNLLDMLPDHFTTEEAELLCRRELSGRGKVSSLLANWKCRGYIVPSEQGEKCWDKTEGYKKR